MKREGNVCILFAVINMNRISELRKEQGLKQAELAQKIRSSRQAIGKWETGAIDLSTDTISRLCAFFGVTSDYLLGLSTQRTAQISDDDAAIVEAYHAAPESVRAGIDALLQPYKEQETSSALPEEQGGA